MRVYEFIKLRGIRGATMREICTALGISENCGRPRVWELEGHVPAGRMPRPALIEMTKERRHGMRVYRVLRG
jgi:hypothetical protein